jgi:hypothetical protein
VCGERGERHSLCYPVEEDDKRRRRRMMKWMIKRVG